MSDGPTGAAANPLGIVGFEELTEIGRGSFGVVYRANQVDFRRVVAIKVLSTAIDDRSRERIHRERQAMGSLTGHRAVVTVFSAGETALGQPFIVMEYLPGGSLAERLETERFAWRDACTIMEAVGDAVAAAHRLGILHRDIKPENIFLDQQGMPKLGDFGIARVAGLGVTEAGVVTASIAHAAPEILDGQAPSAAADVYSLGSTLYQLLDGSPAFVRPDDTSILPVLARVATEPVPDLRSRGVPDAVCRVVERAMAKEPSARYPDADAFVADMRAAVASAGAVTQRWDGPPLDVPPPEVPPPEVPPPTSPPGPRRRRRWPVAVVVAAVALVALAATVVLVGRARSHTGPQSPAVVIDSGARIMCAALRDTTAACWGGLGADFLGPGVVGDRTVPQLVDGITDVVQIGVGDDFACGVTRGQTLRCWGGDPSLSPQVASGLTGVKQVSVGSETACVVLGAGSVQCWGSNRTKELGDAKSADSPTPVGVVGLTDVTQVSVGASTACAVRAIGTAVCWGDNGQGQLGGATTPSSPVPVIVSGLASGVRQVAVGAATACAVMGDGTARCWGAGGDGALGNGSDESSNKPVPVRDLTNATQVTVGRNFACARLATATVSCWGNNSRGQLGNGTTNGSSTPTAVAGLGGVADVVAGDEFACARLDDGTVRCWGNGAAGQLGSGSQDSSTTPVPVAAFTGP
jgi:alpha-tubulin suppressor-like RCC1 family protein/predicted Ser/Thr protein kinase